MTSTLSNWYHNQYSLWNRTRRMQTSPFLARGDAETGARVAAANSQPLPDTIINMGDLLPSPTQNDVTGDNKKKQDTLFGPSIGIVNPGPQWADQGEEKGEKAQMQDALTPELVKIWVEKSKEASQPTTTLQALVNLKRPSLRLSPIVRDMPETSENSQPQQHGLEFQFDCDAPKCGISLYVITLPSGKGASSSTPARLTNVFETVVDGGFGRTLKLEDGATLELDKYDASTQTATSQSSPVDSSTAPKMGSSTATVEQTPAESAPNQSNHKKRFTFRIRKRTHPHAPEENTHMSVTGPALQVLDLETPADGTHGAKDKDEEGVKVLIKLEALDANEHGFASANSQTTYLHIVRLESPPTSLPDNRPWVVRVVKREATIGPHTFHLHEIYGLTSHTSTAPTTEIHTYPPNAIADTDDPTSECLLCLSSPREVVLLPCRHLVACKECAVNMVEFGAGGQLVHAEEAPAETSAVVPAGEPPAEGSNAPGEEGATPPTPQPAAVPRTNPRRKRKAKGWFCPVCRQPYTSLLRISTTAPATALNKAKELDNEDAAPTAESPVPQRSGIMQVISSAAARVTGFDANNTSSAAEETPHETV